jgi:hypothetical protein
MKTLLSLAFAAGLLAAGASSASAMIAPPAPQSHAAGVLEIRDGCGRGWHQNKWGHCVRDYYGWQSRWDGCGRYYHRNRWGRCVRNW